MKVARVNIKHFKRFNDLTIQGLPESARLVVMTGPNGSGKSSVFDAFNVWHELHGGRGAGQDPLYHFKVGLPQIGWGALVQIDLHSGVPPEENERKKLVYVRSAYRNEADFTLSSLNRTPSAFDGPRVAKLIDNDTNVADNYQRLVSASVEGLYSGKYDALKVEELKERYIGQVRRSMQNVFEGLVLQGPGDPLRDGSFFFEKGISREFHYKNLSGGEKAAFNLLLDLIIKREMFDNTVYCIDEPEVHMNTRLQARLLREMVALIPDGCQLWIASHSIGMMREARDLKAASPDEVVFLDFHDQDFDLPVVLEPVAVSRGFWARLLDVALDDLASLVAPSRVVLCEGRPAEPKNSSKAEFDARCYRRIFAEEFADTDFISVGNASDVYSDRLEIGKAIQTIVAGTKVLRVVDRDDRSPQEVQELEAEGVRVLKRRHLESYLMDDETLEALCVREGKPEKLADVLAAKASAMAASVTRGNATDDVKSAAGGIYVETKKILALTGVGNDSNSFLRDTLAPLVVPGTAVYDELKRDVFGV